MNYDNDVAVALQNIITVCEETQQAHQNNEPTNDHAIRIMDSLGDMINLPGTYWVDLGDYLGPAGHRSGSGESLTTDECNQIQPAIDIVRNVLNEIIDGTRNNNGDLTE